MKILVNTSNLYAGGGVQVALSFINELKNNEANNEYYILVSPTIENQLDKSIFDKRFVFYLIEVSPARLLTRLKTIKTLSNIESKVAPDIVFTVFGPSYWTPKSKHVMGFAIPWVVDKYSIAYKELTFSKNLKMNLWVKYVSLYIKKNASNYIVETTDIKEKMASVLNIARDNIFVIGNTYSAVFNQVEYCDKSYENYILLPKKSRDEFRLLLISHNHPNKNLKIINELLPLMKDINIKFVLTIDDNSYKELFPNKPKEVLNLGPVKQVSCPSLYQQCDAVFFPTLLEAFSATYPEAMVMKKPILTSNLSFARDICSDSAMYFNPLEPMDIVEKIKSLINDENLKIELIKKGMERVKTFETAKSRAMKYLKICEKLIKEKNKDV